MEKRGQALIPTLARFLLVAICLNANLSRADSGDEKTCVLSTRCTRTEQQIKDNVPCPDPLSVDTPLATPFAPAPLTSQVDKTNLASACPFLDPNTPLCCGADGLAVTAANYKSLDAVFNLDCPICAVNLKTMWCQYACLPNQSDFVIATGTSTRGDTTYELVTFKLDTDYACEIFKSCKQESFIAQAGIESSIAFLDFLGVNGQNQSDSIITFELTKDDHQSLNDTVYKCEMDIDGTLNSYPDITTCTCGFCQPACAVPPVDDKIAFLDGLSWSKVCGSYIFYIGFTLVFQIVLHCFCRKKGSGLEMSDATGTVRLNENTATTISQSQAVMDYTG